MGNCEYGCLLMVCNGMLCIVCEGWESGGSVFLDLLCLCAGLCSASAKSSRFLCRRRKASHLMTYPLQ